MRKLSILIIGILLFSTVTINLNEVKSVSDIEIVNFHTTSGSMGYMQNSLCEIGFDLRNNTTSSITVSTTLRVYSAFSTFLTKNFEDDIPAETTIKKPKIPFNMAETGNITVEITNVYDSKTYTIVSYKFYEQSFTVNQTKFYAGQTLTSTAQMVNKGDSRKFVMNLTLKDTMNTIIESETKEVTVPPDGVLEATINYTFPTTPRIGTWTIELEICPKDHPLLKLPISTKSIMVEEPSYAVEIESQEDYVVGNDLTYAFTLINKSDISIFFPLVGIDIQNSAGVSMLIEQVDCIITSKNERAKYLYNVTLQPEGRIGSAIKYTVKINLDEALMNEYTGKKWWEKGTYKIVITPEISSGATKDYTKSISIRGLTPQVEVKLMPGSSPAILLKGIDKRIEIDIEFKNPDKTKSVTINAVYLAVEPPAGDCPTPDPEVIPNIILSPWLNPGSVERKSCSFEPSKTDDDEVIEGTYKIYFFLDADHQEELAKPIEIEVLEKEYLSKLNLSIIGLGLEPRIVFRQTVGVEVTVENIGVEKEWYTLYLEVRNATGGLEQSSTYGVREKLIIPEESQTIQWGIPTQDLVLGDKKFYFYIEYGSDEETKVEDAEFNVEIIAPRGTNFEKYTMIPKLSRNSLYIAQTLEVTVVVTNSDDYATTFDVEVSSNLRPSPLRKTKTISGIKDETSGNPNSHTFRLTLTAEKAELNAPIEITVNDHKLETQYVTVMQEETTETTPPGGETSLLTKILKYILSAAVIILVIFVAVLFFKRKRKGGEKSDES